MLRQQRSGRGAALTLGPDPRKWSTVAEGDGLRYCRFGRDIGIGQGSFYKIILNAFALAGLERSRQIVGCLAVALANIARRQLLRLVFSKKNGMRVHGIPRSSRTG